MFFIGSFCLSFITFNLRAYPTTFSSEANHTNHHLLHDFNRVLLAGLRIPNATFPESLG